MAKHYGDGCVKELCNSIKSLGGKHSAWQVFEDFLEVSAISISNAVDWVHSEEREKRYFEIIKRYDKSEVEKFAEMLGILVNALEQCVPRPKDILGEVFHLLELHNKYKGQFFTPQHICDLMGEINFGNQDENIAKKGYITVCEPCVGSGAMIFGIANAMGSNKYNYTKQMVVTATDIDPKCVYMSYLQFSLYGIPAVVIHGDTIAMKEWSRWYTPVYMLDGWLWRQRCGNADKIYEDDEALKMSADPMYVAIKKTQVLSGKTKAVTAATYDIELKTEKNGQLSLF